MLSQDNAAFVEKIEVALDDKQAEKHRRRVMNAELQVLEATLEVRVLEETLKAMEQAMPADRDPGTVVAPGRRWARSSDTVTMRDIEKIRARLESKRETLSATKARARALDLDARGQRPRRTVTSYRLHSAVHHVDCSEDQFARWSDTQRVAPVWISTVEGSRWWWYLDRFWWDESRRQPDEIRALVDESDRASRHENLMRYRSRADVFGKRPRTGDS